MKVFYGFLLLLAATALGQEPSSKKIEATWRLYEAIRKADVTALEKEIKDGADIDANWSTAEIHNKPVGGLLYVTNNSRHSTYTPLEYAFTFTGQANYNFDSERAFEMIKILVKAGANAQPLLRSSAYYGYEKIVDELLANGKGVDLKDSSLLQGAVVKGQTDIVKKLLKKGADAKGLYYDEPLLVYAGNPEVAQLLLDNGADITAVKKKSSYAIFELALMESRLFPFIPFSEQNNSSYYNEPRDKALALLLKKGAPIQYSWQISGLISDAKKLNFKETVSALEERLKQVETAKEPVKR